jgi:beta-xylosidase
VVGGPTPPDPFRDADRSLILYLKNDGNNPRFRQPTRIFAQRLTPDGLHVTGPPVPLLANAAPWEGQVIEAPTMIRRGRAYFLFFSANDYGWNPPRQHLSPYAIGYARCSSAAGPCLAASENPILRSGTGPGYCLSGPGHQAIFTATRRDFIAFHAWSTGPTCRKLGPERLMYVAALHWRNGRPVIGSGVHLATPPER